MSRRTPRPVSSRFRARSFCQFDESADIAARADSPRVASPLGFPWPSVFRLAAIIGGAGEPRKSARSLSLSLVHSRGTRGPRGEADYCRERRAGGAARVPAIVSGSA
jgi:hypothetical protein